jgi:hypothetical protein
MSSHRLAKPVVLFTIIILLDVLLAGYYPNSIASPLLNPSIMNTTTASTAATTTATAVSPIDRSPSQRAVSDDEAVTLLSKMLSRATSSDAKFKIVKGFLVIRGRLESKILGTASIGQVRDSLQPPIRSKFHYADGTPLILDLMALANTMLDSSGMDQLKAFVSVTLISGSTQVYSTTHFDITYTTDAGSPDRTTLSFVQNLGNYLETAYSTEVQQWGYREGFNIAPDGRYQVSVLLLDPLTLGQEHTCWTGTCIDINSLDSDEQSFDAASHEYFHAIQASYCLGNIFSPQWVYEGSAAWMAHEVWRAVNPTANSGFALWLFDFRMNEYLSQPYLDIADRRGDYGYPSGLFWYFLADNTQVNFGSGSKREVVRRFWESFAAGLCSNVNGAINSAVSASGYNFDAAFKLFAVANWFQSAWYPGSPEPAFESVYSFHFSIPQSSSTSSYSCSANGTPACVEHYSAFYSIIDSSSLKTSFAGDGSNFFVKVFSPAGQDMSLSSGSGQTSYSPFSGVLLIVGRLNDLPLNAKGDYDYAVYASSQLTIALSSSQITYGNNVEVSGSLYPSHTGASISIVFTRPSGSTTTVSVSTDGQSKYSTSYTPDATGTWNVYSQWGGDSDHPGATSPQLSFSVTSKPPTDYSTDHTMARGVQSSDPNDPTIRTSVFFYTDASAYSWLRFENLYSGHMVTWYWYDPNGNLATTTSQTMSPPPDGQYWIWYKVWAWLYASGSVVQAAASSPSLPSVIYPPSVSSAAYPASLRGLPAGQWRVELYFDGTRLLTEVFEIRVESVLVDTTTCRDVMPSSPYDPIDRTPSFTTSDQKALVWLYFIDVEISHTVRWDWYQPNGNLYTSTSYTIPDPSSSGYLYWSWYKTWAWIAPSSLSGSLLGSWQVRVYYDGNYLTALSFVVTRPSATMELDSRDIIYLNQNPANSPELGAVLTVTYTRNDVSQAVNCYTYSRIVVDQSTTLTVSVNTPPAGYTFENTWLDYGNGNVVTAPTLAVSVGNLNHIVIAYFSPVLISITVYSIDLQFKGQDPSSLTELHGSVFNSYQNSASTTAYSFQVPANTQVTLSVSSDPGGWAFANWWDDYGLSGQSNTQTLTINVGTSNHKVAAFFTQSGIVYSVVRGTDNRIYHGSDVAGSWSGWTALPGATSDSPGAAVCGGLLNIAVRGSDNGIYYGYVALSTNGFSGWTRLSGATPSAPGLAAASDCTLYLVVRGKDNGIYLNVLPSGGSWSGWRRLPGATVDGPAVALAGSTVHFAVRGADGSSIWHGRMDRSSMNWLGWTQLSGSTPSKPALAAGPDPDVYLAVTGTNNRVYLRRWNGDTWSMWETIPTGSTPSGPSVVAANGQLYVGVRGMNNAIYTCSRSLTWWEWSSWSKLPGATPSSPTLA